MSNEAKEFIIEFINCEGKTKRHALWCDSKITAIGLFNKAYPQYEAVSIERGK